MKKKITVVIPALNEGKVVKYAVERVFEAYKKYSLDWECLIMDSSTDGGITKKTAEQYGARVISIPKQGLGKAYIDSLEHIQWNYVIMWDADGTYDFMEMDRLIDKLDKGYDFVMGTRLKWNIHPWAMPWKNRYIWTPILTFFINLFFNAKISDCNSGLRAITLDAFKKIKLESRWREYASEMIVKAKLTHLKMCEVPISLLADREGRMPHLPAYAAWRANLKYIILLASEFVFIKIGFIISLFWLFILLSQLFGTITIGVFTFGTFYLFLWVLFCNIWFSILQMGVLTQNFSYLNQFRTTHISKRIEKKFTFEKGIILWVSLFSIWFLIDLTIFIAWRKTGQINIESFRIWLYALFFIITSIQIIYFSFIYYLFNKYKNH